MSTKWNPPPRKKPAMSEPHTAGPTPERQELPLTPLQARLAQRHQEVVDLATLRLNLFMQGVLAGHGVEEARIIEILATDPPRLVIELPGAPKLEAV
jgi:hypothetical protein